MGAWLVHLLSAFVEEHDLGVVAYDVRVRLGEGHSRLGPDIVFVANEHRSQLRPGHVEGPPDLIVEIVSPGGEARDWREKYLEYEAAGVREYWVIDHTSQHMEAYALSPADAAAPSSPLQYRRIEEKEGWVSSVVLAGLRLRTSWLWPATCPKVLDALRQQGQTSA